MNGAVGGSHDADIFESAKSVEETLSLSCWLSADLKRIGTSKACKCWKSQDSLIYGHADSTTVMMILRCANNSWARTMAA